jgi:hypothetical protein
VFLNFHPELDCLNGPKQVLVPPIKHLMLQKLNKRARNNNLSLNSILLQLFQHLIYILNNPSLSLRILTQPKLALFPIPFHPIQNLFKIKLLAGDLTDIADLLFVLLYASVQAGLERDLGVVLELGDLG